MCTRGEGIHDGISNDNSNCGQISDKDFQQFLSWWSTCKKGTVISKQLTNRHVEEGDTSKKIAEPVRYSGELSDELLAHFFSICSDAHSSPMDAKQTFLMRGLVKEPTARTSTQNDGQLSDEDFNSFMSAWSTCERPFAHKSIAPALLKNDGMLHDEEFQNFMHCGQQQRKLLMVLFKATLLVEVQLIMILSHSGLLKLPLVPSWFVLFPLTQVWKQGVDVWSWN